MKLKKTLSAIAAAAVILQAASSVCAYDTTLSPEYQVFEQIADYASEYYIDDSLSPEEIMRMGLSKTLEENPDIFIKVLKDMFAGLDPYCEYFTAEEYESFKQNLDKYSYGIGATLQKIGSYITVMAFTDESYAPASGVQIGDKIVKVEDRDVVGSSLNSVVSLLLSETTTPVNLTLLRGSEYVTVSVPRSEIQSKTVFYNFPDDNTAYIKISNMSVNTSKEFSEALAAADAHHITNIILDLRGNPGGYVNAAVQIAAQITPKGKIADTIYRVEEYNASYYSEQEDPKYKFNVLVNGNTASASELLAAALHDSGVGYLIGETTYGKALMQVTISLNNGSAFKITTGRYLTRNGEDINGVGIMPDDVIQNTKRAITTSDYGELDYRTKWHVGMSGPEVVAAKNRLTILGYFDGAINDLYDAETAAAVMDFQADQELFPYGELDITTQVRLENVFAEINVTVDNQLNRAYELFGVNTSPYEDEDANE